MIALDYLKCTVFYLIFVVLLSALGKAVLKEKRDWSYRFVTGYLIYSFFIAAAGIPVQILNVPWVCFAVYTGLLWIVLFFLAFRAGKGLTVRKAAAGVKEYVQAHWMLLLVCGALVFMLFFFFRPFWYGNHMDDGYYITKVASMPYNKSGFYTNYAVGTEQKLFDSYTVNTWELESSVYVRVLGVSATLFLRLFQSAFQYFLLLNCAAAVIRQIFAAVDDRLKRIDAQFPLVVILLFDFYYVYMEDSNLFFVNDFWRFHSGMFLGASIVHTMCLFLLVMPHINLKKITGATVAKVAAVSFVLISKSSIALPDIGMIAYGFLVSWLFFCTEGRRGKYGAGILTALWALAGCFLPDGTAHQEVVYQSVSQALHSPVFLFCTVIFFTSFLLNSRVIRQLNGLLLFMACAMVVPQFNDVFETLSVYAFVSGRAWTMFAYGYVMLNAAYLYLLLRKFVTKEYAVRGIYGGTGCVLAVLMLYVFRSYGGELFQTEEPGPAGLVQTPEVLLQNPEFFPESTIRLGESLEKLQEEKGEQLYVACPLQVIINDTLHPVSVLFRIYAPDVVSVSAVGRYSVTEDSPLYGWNQNVFDAFIYEPEAMQFKALKEELEKFEVNCVLAINSEADIYLRKAGYEYCGSVSGIYHIWYKSYGKEMEKAAVRQ